MKTAQLIEAQESRKETEGGQSRSQQQACQEVECSH